MKFYTVAKNTLTAAIFAVMMGAVFSASASALSDEDIATLRGEAQQLVAEKKPEEALAKIVQVILARPADLPARFFRSQLLVSMGRGAEVKAELELMTTLNIPEGDKQKARQLIDAIEKQGRKFSGSITVKAGFGYGNNVNSWPNGGETTGNSGVNAAMPDPIYQKYGKISDTIRTASLSFSGSYILNEKRSLKSNYGFSTSYKDGADTVSVDNKIFSARAGLQNDFDAGTTLKANVAKTSLDRVNKKNEKTVTSDLDITSYDIEISQKMLENVSIGYKMAKSTNKNTKIDNAKNSDSNNTTHSVYIGSPIGKTAYGRVTYSQAQARAVENNETAKKKVNKDTNSLSALLVRVLPHNQRIIATASYSEGTHLKKIFTNTNKKRLDKTQSYTIGYTIKGEEIWKRLGDLTFGVDGTYSKTSSNQASARVHARTLSFNISRKFDL